MKNQILKNAHAIARTLEGDYRACLKEGMRQAWAATKCISKTEHEVVYYGIDKGYWSGWGSYFNASNDLVKKVTKEANANEDAAAKEVISDAINYLKSFKESLLKKQLA